MCVCRHGSSCGSVLLVLISVAKAMYRGSNQKLGHVEHCQHVCLDTRQCPSKKVSLLRPFGTELSRLLSSFKEAEWHMHACCRNFLKLGLILILCCVWMVVWSLVLCASAAISSFLRGQEERSAELNCAWSDLSASMCVHTVTDGLKFFNRLIV